jgi:hypothetical protein
MNQMNRKSRKHMEEKREERKNLQLKFELESINLKSPEATVS